MAEDHLMAFNHVSQFPLTSRLSVLALFPIDFLLVKTSGYPIRSLRKPMRFAWLYRGGPGAMLRGRDI